MRDYVHVVDIARAHVLGLQKIDTCGGRAYNLGNGNGYSVLQVLVAASKVTGARLFFKFLPRRPGDPAVLLASADKARNDLGWKPLYPDIHSIIQSAWNWMKNRPDGYDAQPVHIRVPVSVPSEEAVKTTPPAAEPPK